jgi:hypothetical protein
MPTDKCRRLGKTQPNPSGSKSTSNLAAPLNRAKAFSPTYTSDSIAGTRWRLSRQPAGARHRAHCTVRCHNKPGNERTVARHQLDAVLALENPADLAFGPEVGTRFARGTGQQVVERLAHRHEDERLRAFDTQAEASSKGVDLGGAALPLYRVADIDSEQPLRPLDQAAAARLVARQPLFLQQHDMGARRRQVQSGGRAGGAAPHHRHVVHPSASCHRQ